jgi:GNAT superfamily N-acetyltransferase
MKHPVTLAPPVTPEQWSSYHELRRAVLFENRGRFGVYDENHPDEFLPNNYPMLLYRGSEGVGAVRIDIDPEARIVTFRRVAIRQDLQRQGLGRMMMEEAEAFARGRGCRVFVAHVARDAVGFYEKLGYRLDLGFKGSVVESPRMVKRD